ncbi:SidA/IucD/PvdA family monooxygenase [Corynebacterium sp. 13CS0277]|uniref:SidA/IucD/PvdA family monooxygenase n=1 Tax=Corynebacterium sp. 13CS0277 TaxID=2071994 RepID=UPI001304C0AA|nr:SidA/IucD/PvdA family monooxygenase [Corynebacterium sp. 13CS0277]
MRELVVIGAGPKAVAVAAKAWALRACGGEVPRITVVEQRGIAAHWQAGGGWTNGRHYLGTPPEKDVGFPYATAIAGNRGSEVDRLLEQVSWKSFLLATGGYARWLDRGRPAPTHDRWAEYLQWVARTIGMEVLHATVERCERVDSARWECVVRDAAGRRSMVSADAVLVTGPGPATDVLSTAPGVWSVAQLWERSAALAPGGRWVLVGSGESAGAVAQELIYRGVDSLTLVSPQATAFSRGESQFENSLYSDPGAWQGFDAQARRAVLARTDRGVLSRRAQEALALSDSVEHVSGVARRARSVDGVVHLEVERPGAVVSELEADVVVDCRGGDPLWFLSLLGGQARAELTAECGGLLSPEAVAEVLQPTMWCGGMPLLVPALAGWSQGPGFANLSCLGALADRVLGGLGVELGEESAASVSSVPVVAS